MDPYCQYSDELLLLIAKGFDDEEYPFAIIELSSRKHPETGDICMMYINAHIDSEREIHSLGDTRSALSDLYSFDVVRSIAFFKANYDKLPLDAFAGFVEEYAVDMHGKSAIIDMDLIRIIKDYFKTIPRNKQIEMMGIYNNFEDALKVK
jgi:hypothetical protein